MAYRMKTLFASLFYKECIFIYCYFLLKYSNKTKLNKLSEDKISIIYNFMVIVKVFQIRLVSKVLDKIIYKNSVIYRL